MARRARTPPHDGANLTASPTRVSGSGALLANRVLSASRPKYADFLRWHGFDPADPPEPLLLLQRSEGIKKTDAIEVFPCPVPDDQGCYLKSSTREGGRDERFLVGASRLRSRRSQISDPHP